MESSYRELLSRRLAQLRIQKGVSARDMSLTIGQSENYVNHIENQKAQPSMTGFYYICDYLGIHPKDFWDEGKGSPALYDKLEGKAEGLTPRQTALLVKMAEKANKLTSEQAELVAKLIEDMTK